MVNKYTKSFTHIITVIFVVVIPKPVQCLSYDSHNSKLNMTTFYTLGVRQCQSSIISNMD